MSTVQRLLPDVAFPCHLLRDGARTVASVRRRWTQRHRCWHGAPHLENMAAAVLDLGLPEEAREVLLLAALYHDAVYDPTRATNELRSAELLRADALDPTCAAVQRAYEIILASAWDKPVPMADHLLARFQELDCAHLAEPLSLPRLMNYERAVFREYQHVPYPEYVHKRRAFLHRFGQLFPQYHAAARMCDDLIVCLSPRIALYPGTFDPFHVGHLSVLRQAERVFDKVIIAVGTNGQKRPSEVPSVSRARTLASRLRHHQVIEMPDLLVSELENRPEITAVVRGVRGGMDAEAEARIAWITRSLRPGTDIVWLQGDDRYRHLTSSLVRELSDRGGPYERYIPTRADVYGPAGSPLAGDTADMD